MESPVTSWWFLRRLPHSGAFHLGLAPEGYMPKSLPVRR
jgi:hypothetical protein